MVLSSTLYNTTVGLLYSTEADPGAPRSHIMWDRGSGAQLPLIAFLQTFCNTIHNMEQEQTMVKIKHCNKRILGWIQAGDMSCNMECVMC